MKKPEHGPEVGGITFPCYDCRYLESECSMRESIFRKMFFAIGNRKTVYCEDYDEIRWHGLEGVKP